MKPKNNIKTFKELCIIAIKKSKINIAKLDEPVIENYPPSDPNIRIINEFLTVTSDGV